MTNAMISAKKAIHSTSPIYWFNQAVASHGEVSVLNDMAEQIHKEMGVNTAQQ